MIATAWTPKVKLSNNRVSIQITKEERLYLIRPIIIFQMPHRQTNHTFRTRNLNRKLSQTRSHQELKSKGKERALLILGRKFKVKMAI